jgi:DNA-binding response OmpR family regulator
MVYGGSIKKAPSKDSNPILIVEDDRKTASLVALYLEREGFKTVVACDGHQALELARRHNPVFVVLDLMLPKMDGWEVCRTIRRSSDVPILILTAREEEMDRILGLSLGADDYVVKPFSPRELVARVKAILRRTRSESRDQRNLLSFGDLVLDLQKRRVTLDNRPISLTRFEYNLLATLMAAPGKIFSREELLTCLYPTGEAVIDRVIDVHIGKLRQKIEDNLSNPQYILTVRGLGYCFADKRDQ